MKTQYDNYPICHVSREVRDYLRESDKELKRQQDQDYQYSVFFHAFDVEERVRRDPGNATYDPIYAVGSVSSLSAEKAYFRREAQKALMNAIMGLSASARRRLLLHFYLQQTYTEIARREGVTEGAVRNQMSATLAILRRALESQGISRSDFNCPSPYDYTDFYTKNGRKARAKAESAAGQKQAPSQGSGGRDAA